MLSYARCPRFPPRLLWTLVLGLALVLGAASCSPGNEDHRQSAAREDSVVLKGAGATFPYILYKQWFAAYGREHPGTTITYQPVGSGEGIRRFIGRNVKEEERIDFGASDAAMTDAEMALVDRGALAVPATAGGIVLAYNLPGLSADLKLSRAACAGIFLGEIKKWNDPAIARTNPGITLPRLSIVTVVRQDRSGTTFAFTNHLGAFSERWRSRYGTATYVDWPGNAMRVAGNEGVAGRISHSVGAIGYVGYEYAHRLGLQVAAVENREGRFVKPTAESFAAALTTAHVPDDLRVFIPDPPGEAAYPIVTFTWILLYEHYDTVKKAAVQDFFNWCLGRGQSFAPEKGYLPLPQEVAAKGASALATISVAGPP